MGPKDTTGAPTFPLTEAARLAKRTRIGYNGAVIGYRRTGSKGLGMVRSVCVSFLMLGAIAARASGAPPGDTRPLGPREQTSLRIYDVADLAELGKEYPYAEAAQPPTRLVGWTAPVREGPVFGCKFPDLPDFDDSPQRRRERRPLNAEELAELVRILVDPDSWSDLDVGGAGPGFIRPVGKALIVRQTKANHQRVEQFLELLRGHYLRRRRVLIEALWLTARAGTLPVVPDGAGADAPGVPAAVALDALDKAGVKTVYRGRITGFDGQRLHLASGPAQSLVYELVPVVSGAATAAHPMVRIVQWGPVLDVTASILPDGRRVLLDLSAVATRSRGLRTNRVQVALQRGDGRPPGPPDGMDLFECDVQLNLQSTLTAPLGRAVVVGAATQPTDDDGPPTQMYLVLKVTVSRPDAPGKAAPAKPQRKGKADEKD